jgi:uncharacterized protein (TIGR01777 family)
MTASTFVRRSRMPAPAAEVFAWHERPGALERLTPPWSPVRVLEREGGIRNGRVVLGIPVGPLTVRWVAQHRDYVAGRQFRDEQVSGPFARWIHTHTIEPAGEDEAMLEDRIEWALPGGPLGAWIGSASTRGLLDRLFTWRHRTTAEDLAAHAPCRAQAMSVAVTGASGLVGRSVVPFLETGGHRVVRLVRDEEHGPDVVRWDPERPTDLSALDGIDAVVHLAGESIASGRWTDERKRRILESRARGTRVLCESLAALPHPPGVIVAASAIGIYGDRGDEQLDEDSAPGTAFLADVCRAWEAATEPLARSGTRIVTMRFGVVLTPAGGALAQMLPPFRVGLGGPIGSGNQYLSWIAIDDLIGAIHHALVTDALEGPVNAVAPSPVRNKELAAALGRALHRPAIVPIPAAALRLALGEVADALLLASARVLPRRLETTNFHFRTPTIDPALAHVLGTR